MNISHISHTMTDPDWLMTVLVNIVLPIVVALLTYLLVDRLGEWKKRRMYSMLGVAIIESLQEEIENGINLMTNALNAAEDKSATLPPTNLLPNKSWSGMSTIPDEVLLRIIETSANGQFKGFPPRQCRIHCKNYFEHICQNFKQTLDQALNTAQHGLDWRSPIRDLLADHKDRYINSATEVYQMLEYSKGLLEKNSHSWFPM